MAATGTGLQLGLFDDGSVDGTLTMWGRMTGNGNATGYTEWRETSVGNAQGRTGTDATLIRGWWLRGRFVCSESGALAIAYARGGSSNDVTVHAGAGGLVIASA